MSDNFPKSFLELGLSQNNAHAKSLAYFLFREVIEDVHSKYNISNGDMKEMCKNAVDRAAFFLNHIVNDPKLYKSFAIFAVYCSKWDNPEETEYTNNLLQLLKELSE
ncbi:MAG: hypothetical protein Q4D26_10300 [Clostridia bacterium]|nr:hypothetical protein [Clostridia bacterium]